MNNSMMYVIIVIAVCILIFMVTREFWCWYFKINKNNELLEQILNELKKVNKSNSSEKIDDIYFANKMQVNKKNEESKKEETEAKKEESESNEPVEDPFWNKK